MTRRLDALIQSLDRVAERLPEKPKRDRWRNPHDRDNEYDEHGRVPKRFSLSLAVRSVPGMAERFRQVPSRAVAEEGTDDDGDYSLVACPCGEKPVVRSALAQCPGCERWYMRLEAVWVFYGDMELPVTPAQTVAAP